MVEYARKRQIFLAVVLHMQSGGRIYSLLCSFRLVMLTIMLKNLSFLAMLLVIFRLKRSISAECYATTVA